MSITNKTKLENQLKEKLNSYTQPCNESFNPKELIKFLNNKSLIYNQIHNTYYKNPEIQQWAYDNDKIKYAQLKNDLKLLNNNIIRAPTPKLQKQPNNSTNRI